MLIPLSVLDLSPIAAGSKDSEALTNTLDLARTVDRLGYTRYWLAEHHSIPSVASTAPEIMIGHVASVTERVRVGSGGDDAPKSCSVTDRRRVPGSGSVTSRRH
jgi:alkanesulfonate monooxygenase SsuD/methylene tetrahydromethanopterin reductase-like flavin-dependent oxidoreductase (luciferase family)